MRLDVAAVVRRGGQVESVHAADVAVVDGDGNLVAWFGEPDRPAFLRSAWKPLQAAVSYRCGLHQRFGIEPGSKYLAIMSASHGATDAQRAAVLDLLALAGLDESCLLNGTHIPESEEGRRHLAGRAPTALYGNCSGKHAGMLAACVAQGWDLKTYLSPDHPLQVLCRETLAEMMALPVEQVVHGIDGCGLPTWCAPLRAGAFAFAKLLDPIPEGGEETALGSIGVSIQAHRHLLGPLGGFNVRLLQAMPEVAAKGGAEAAFCIALPGRIGIAVKVLDGGQRAIPPVVLAVLEQLGAITPDQLAALEDLRRPLVHSLAGEVAGEIEAVLELRRP